MATVEPSSPTPLLCPANGFTPTDITTDSPDFRAPIGLDRNVEEDMEETPMNDDGHAYMEGSNMEADERILSLSDNSSGYEQRDKVVVDLGDDDLAEGYRIRNLWTRWHVERFKWKVDEDPSSTTGSCNKEL